MPIVASVGHRVHYKLLNPLLRLVLYMVLTFHPPPCAAWLLCLLLFFLPVVFLFYMWAESSADALAVIETCHDLIQTHCDNHLSALLNC